MASATISSPFIAGNYFDKYRTKNPLYRALLAGFLSDAKELVSRANPQTVVEVGCASGDLGWHIFNCETAVVAKSLQYTGIDICPDQIANARARYPQLEFQTASAYELPYSDSSVDMVILCEVLEHLERPEAALAEAVRITRRHVLVSVPWESTWRILNMLRGKYLLALGNTPGHMQHFSRRAIRKLVSSRLEITVERKPFPWTMLLAQRFPSE